MEREAVLLVSTLPHPYRLAFARSARERGHFPEVDRATILGGLPQRLLTA
jgi:hypothetical protein